MEHPKRIQRKRTKGWKIPENTVSVTRPGKWGNPFRVGMDISDCAFVVVKNAELNDDEQEKGVVTAEVAVRFYRIWLSKHIGSYIYESAIKELRGKNLACWCKEGEPCHGDVLLEIANR